MVGESCDHGGTEENALSAIQVLILYLKLMPSIRQCRKIYKNNGISVG